MIKNTSLIGKLIITGGNIIIPKLIKIDETIISITLSTLLLIITISIVYSLVQILEIVMPQMMGLIKNTPPILLRNLKETVIN